MNTSTRHSSPTVDAVFRELVDSGVEITADSDAAAELLLQVSAIVHDAEVSLGLVERIDDHRDAPGALSRTIGRSRARDSVHPSVSLDAASRVFDVALPLLITALPGEQADPSAAVRVSRALHRAIMVRVGPAAVGYVEALLEKLALAQHEERLRLSRELHDHVAHNVAAAIQRIVLLRSEGVGGEAMTWLRTAESLMRGALAETRTIGVELRQVVGDRMLDEAVREYVGANPALAGLVEVRTVGDPVALPVTTGEEVYVIIREALRNAVTHAEARSVSVLFVWSHGVLSVEVRDDGAGFRLDHRPSSSMGVLAMRERAEAIGAVLTVSTRMGSGTTVALEVDHERGLA